MSAGGDSNDWPSSNVSWSSKTSRVHSIKYEGLPFVSEIQEDFLHCIENVYDDQSYKEPIYDDSFFDFFLNDAEVQDKSQLIKKIRKDREMHHAPAHSFYSLYNALVDQAKPGGVTAVETGAATAAAEATRAAKAAADAAAYVKHTEDAVAAATAAVAAATADTKAAAEEGKTNADAAKE